MMRPMAQTRYWSVRFSDLWKPQIREMNALEWVCFSTQILASFFLYLEYCIPRATYFMFFAYQVTFM